MLLCRRNGGAPRIDLKAGSQELNVAPGKARKFGEGSGLLTAGKSIDFRGSFPMLGLNYRFKTAIDHAFYVKWHLPRHVTHLLHFLHHLGVDAVPMRFGLEYDI